MGYGNAEADSGMQSITLQTMYKAAHRHTPQSVVELTSYAINGSILSEAEV